MADFRRSRTFKTREPLLKVDPGLPVGTYVFRLEVEDQNGNRSRAARIKMKIVGASDPVRPGGGGVVIAPTRVISGPIIGPNRI
jgi:hypothetical protein